MPERILLVEDDPLHVELVRRAFRDADVVLEVAGSIEEARRATGFDIVITDFKLPDGTGLDLLPGTLDEAQAPIIVLTSHGDERTAVEAMKMGAFDYVVKSPDSLRSMPEVVTRSRRQWQHVVERRRAANALRESEERFRQLAANIRGVFWLIDLPGGAIEYVSPGFESTFGSDRTILDAAPDAWLDLVVPEDRERVRAASFGTSEAEAEFRLLNDRWILHRVFPIREGGDVVRLAAISEDVTERRFAQERNTRLEDRLRQSQKLEALGTLASGVAHDFNNLLTAINGLVDMAERELGEDHAARASLDAIVNATESAGSVTRSLLTFARRAPSHVETIDLARVIGETSVLIRALLPRHIELRTELEPCWIQADRTQMQQLLINLCINARDAMPTGGAVTVSLAHSRSDRRFGDVNAERGLAVLLVSDTGEGVAPEHLSRIFEPFFTTKDREDGTGLGLSVVHSIVKEHAGAIDVSSDEGGTSVVAAFPITETPRTDVEALGTAIVVSSDRQQRAVLTTALVGAGFDVRADATDPALLVVTDPEQIERARAAHPEAVMIVVTGADDPDPPGAPTCVLRRPFRVADLVEIAKDALAP
ncbi:MAG: response regulator [Phycisphaerales bacterium]|nr:response regulator [Phycisphaerales bacterium]